MYSTYFQQRYINLTKQKKIESNNQHIKKEQDVYINGHQTRLLIT